MASAKILKSWAIKFKTRAKNNIMNKFTVLDGLVAPLDRANVDTDAIIPKQFLKSIHRTGFGPNLFDAWRYLDHGEPGMDNSKRPLNPDFVLNQVRYQGASILLARKNFGCGSSREHAPVFQKLKHTPAGALGRLCDLLRPSGASPPPEWSPPPLFFLLILPSPLLSL